MIDASFMMPACFVRPLRSSGVRYPGATVAILKLSRRAPAARRHVQRARRVAVFDKLQEKLPIMTPIRIHLVRDEVLAVA